MVNSSLGTLGSQYQSGGSSSPISIGFVVDIIIDEQHPRFKEVDGLVGIGSVIYQESVDAPINLNLLPVAFPLEPNISHFPVIGEQVLVFNSIPDYTGITHRNYYKLINTSNSPQKNKQSRLETTGSLSNPHIPLRANPNDTLIEGRHNGSVRFSSDEKGNGIMMLGTSSTPTGSASSRKEDINGNDSMIIISSDQKIPASVPTSYPKSFAPESKPTGSNLILPDNRVIPLSEPFVEGDEIDIVPFRLIDYQVQEQEQENLELVEIRSIAQYDGPMTIVDDNNRPYQRNDVVIIPRRKVNVGEFSKSAGQITANLPNGVKALLDLIAFMEGTLGVSNNGYDVCFGGVLIKGWNPKYQGGHPNIRQTAKGVTTSACGRYQFLYKTWAGNGGNIPFNKDNQDIRGAKLVQARTGNSMYSQFEKYFNTIEGACQVFAKISPEWASFPKGSSNYGYYSDALNGAKVRYPHETMRNLFNTAYKLYTRVS